MAAQYYSWLTTSIHATFDSWLPMSSKFKVSFNMYKFSKPINPYSTCNMISTPNWLVLHAYTSESGNDKKKLDSVLANYTKDPNYIH